MDGDRMIEPRAGITFADFLAWEQEQEHRHELIGGEVVAFAGGSLDHEGIAANIVAKLRAAVDPPCLALGSSAVVETVSRNRTNGFRPDVVVSCSRDNVGTALYVREPLIIVEVVSPSNSGRKWNEKLIEYTLTPSIAQLVLVEARTRVMSSYVREATGAWQAPVTVEEVGRLEFTPLGFAMSLDEIYAATSLAR
jgi:Uma2 family endonuclease